MLHKLIKIFKLLIKQPRKGWFEAFEKYVQEDEDELII